MRRWLHGDKRSSLWISRLVVLQGEVDLAVVRLEEAMAVRHGNIAPLRSLRRSGLEKAALGRLLVELASDGGAQPRLEFGTFKPGSGWLGHVGRLVSGAFDLGAHPQAMNWLGCRIRASQV